MDLIDRYAAAVGRNLPEKQRADIESELRSILEDMLEDRAAKTGKPADQALATELLLEYGEPAKVAASYGKPRYLVGPELYPDFWRVVKLVSLVLVGVFAGLFILGLFFSGSFPEMEIASFFETLTSLGSALLSAFGIITLIFFFIQRSGNLPESSQAGWHPRDLPEVIGKDMVSKPSELIAGILFSLFFLGMLNFYFDKIGIYFFEDETWSQLAYLTEGFKAFVPALSVLLIGNILLSAWVLRQGSWSTLTRWMEVALNLATAAVSLVILLTPALATADASIATVLQEVGQAFNEQYPLEAAYSLPLRIVFGIILVISLIEAITSGYKLLRKTN